MSKKLGGIILSLGIVVIACVASSGCLDWFKETPMDHTYYYEVRIGCDQTIYNVTVYLPIPMVNGVIHSIMNKTAYPIIDTEHGKMLKISLDVVELGTQKGFDLKLEMDVDKYINAKNPREGEPLLYPRFNESDSPSSVDEFTLWYRYSSYIYASYNSSSETSVYVLAALSGSNTKGDWGESYDDDAEAKLIGENNSWQIAKGRLIIER